MDGGHQIESSSEPISEFVLASSPQEDQRVQRMIPLEKLMNSNAPISTCEYVTKSSPNFAKRVTRLWLLVLMLVVTLKWTSFGNRYLATAKKFCMKGIKICQFNFWEVFSSCFIASQHLKLLACALSMSLEESQANIQNVAMRAESSLLALAIAHPGVFNPSGSTRGNTSCPGGSRYGGTGRENDEYGSVALAMVAVALIQEPDARRTKNFPCGLLPRYLLTTTTQCASNIF